MNNPPANEEFLKTIFKSDYIWAHCCSFRDDPSNISPDRRLRCWSGNYYSRTAIIPDSNQYFCISTFMADEKKKARRRKALFRATHIIVADDVREKLPIENVNKLPPPTYKLATSPGSEQWGWVLNHPCTNRTQVENLLDGLVAQGLAPAGKDPGMKGVTRYVRLPEGVNTKAKRVEANGGIAPKCTILKWNPERVVSIETLALPFNVDINAPRRESRVDGAADVPDHPLLDLADIIHIKDVRSKGRFDITCPWVTEHTGQVDDGAAIFTNKDGSIGFKCHHGSCQHRTGKDLLDLIEESYPGFRSKLSQFQTSKEFESILSPSIKDNNYDFLGTSAVITSVSDTQSSQQQLTEQTLYKQLKQSQSESREAIDLAQAILKIVDVYPHAIRLQWHENIRIYMGWTKLDLKSIIVEGRKKWYMNEDEGKTIADLIDTVFKDHCYIIELGQFYNRKKNTFLKPELFQNGFSHLDEDIRTEALMNLKCVKADKIDYAPGFPEQFQQKGINYINTWVDDTDKGTPGDCKPWLDLFNVLGWGGSKREHILNFFAYTLQYPEIKINHALVLGGGEGIGKDTLIYPMIQSLGRNASVVQGCELMSNFNSYLLNTKFLQINEMDAGNYLQAQAISNKMKGFITAPPETIWINQKMIPGFEVRNIVNVIMSTNETRPFVASQDSRRFYVVWSDLNIQGEDNQVLSHYKKYYNDLWTWLRDNKGWRYCIDFLMQRDVSQFNPRTTPTATDDLIDIREASMDPVLMLFRECVLNHISLFKSDLLTIRDIYSVMASVNSFQMGVTIKKIPSENVLARVIKQSNFAKMFRVSKNNKTFKLYCIRNLARYNVMTKVNIRKQYTEQITIAKSTCNLKQVNE